jgi:hypothetical protein
MNFVCVLALHVRVRARCLPVFVACVAPRHLPFHSWVRSHAIEVLADAITKGVPRLNATALYGIMKQALIEQDSTFHRCIGGVLGGLLPLTLLLLWWWRV